MKPCPHYITLDDGGYTSEEGNLHYTTLTFPCIHALGHELPHEADLLGVEGRLPWPAVLRWPGSSVIEASRTRYVAKAYAAEDAALERTSRHVD